MTEGVCCPHAHYTCADCFDAHVRNEAGKDLALLAKCDGRILCPRNTAANTDADRCDAPHFPDKDIAAAVSHDTFEAYLDARSKLRERLVAEEMEAQMEARLRLERERAKRGAGKEEKLRVAKEHVIETILTLACPRCKQAFVDFDGCFALKCSRCAAAFCAYCLADCGRDAHQHVGTCPEGQASVKAAKKQKGVGGRAIGNLPATVYGTKDAFDVAQKRRRCRYLALYLEKLDESGQRELVSALATELKDLDIAEKDVRHWQKKEAKAMQDRAAAQSNAAARQAPRIPANPHRGQGGRRRGADARGLLDQVVNAAFGRENLENGIFDAIFGHRGVPGGVPGNPNPNNPADPGFVPPAPRGGARRRRDHALQQHIRHIPAMNDDEFEDLLAAGFFDQPPPPGGPPGLRGRAPPAAGRVEELPEGVIGPIRRARMERKKREAEERARAPPVVVDLSGKNAREGGDSPGGDAATATVDLVASQKEETRSPGSSTSRQRRGRAGGTGPANSGGEAVFVDLT